MLKEELQRIRTIMGLNEGTAPLDYDADYFIKRIPFLKNFENFSDDKKVLFKKIDYNENISLMVGDDIQTFPQFNTVMEFTYMKDTMSTDRYRHMFNIRNDLRVLPPKTKNPREKLTYRALIMAFNMMVDKLGYNADIITETPNLTEEQLNKVINGINKAYFDFEEFIQNQLNLDIKNPFDRN